MKNLFIFLILSCSLCGTTLQADMSELAEIMREEMQQMSFVSSEKNSVETYVIKYATAADGSHMHFGIWIDCIIGTIVGNGPNIGAQMIMLPDGSVYDCSTDYSRKKDYFVNKYPWGKVTSWDYKQEIQRK